MNEAETEWERWKRRKRNEKKNETKFIRKYSNGKFKLYAFYTIQNGFFSSIRFISGIFVVDVTKLNANIGYYYKRRRGHLGGVVIFLPFSEFTWNSNEGKHFTSLRYIVECCYSSRTVVFCYFFRSKFHTEYNFSFLFVIKYTSHWLSYNYTTYTIKAI